MKDYVSETIKSRTMKFVDNVPISMQSKIALYIKNVNIILRDHFDRRSLE